MFSKKITITGFIVVAVLLGSLIVYHAYAQSASKTDTAVTATEKTKKAEELRLKMQKKLDNANADIKKSFQLEDKLKDYAEIKLENVGSCDPEIFHEFQALDNAPIGSTKPLILIKKDNSEILFLYKEKDGDNVMWYAKKINGQWEKGAKKTKGVPILDD